MHSKLPIGLLKSSAMLCMRVHVSDASVGLSSLFGPSPCGTAPLASKSHITDMFAGLFDLFPMSWRCMRAVCVPACLRGFRAHPLHLGTALCTQ